MVYSQVRSLPLSRPTNYISMLENKILSPSPLPYLEIHSLLFWMPLKNIETLNNARANIKGCFEIINNWLPKLFLRFNSWNPYLYRMSKGASPGVLFVKDGHQAHQPITATSLIRAVLIYNGVLIKWNKKTRSSLERNSKVTEKRNYERTCISHGKIGHSSFWLTF